MTSKDKATALLAKAGVTINGTQPYDMQVHDERLYDRVLSSGSLALGESYMDGWWDVEDLSTFFHKVFVAHLERQIEPLSMLWTIAKASIFNLQNKDRSKQVGKQHYDAGNDLYQRMLDKRMVYSCGYWSSPTTPAQNLDDAQEQKLDLICRKLNLQQGQTILDIGCGWGSFAKFAAEKYGVKVVGITISEEQAKLARERCKGLDVEIRFEDYRDTTGQFDHVVSVGMFEHVGPKNYRTYMLKVKTLLKDGGMFLLHTIGQNKSYMAGDSWIDKYIFPGGVLPSVAQIGKAIDDQWVMEDWHNFGPDYHKTLLVWAHNFETHWSEIKDQYDERFYRMFRYYLYICAGFFSARQSQLWQIVLTKDGISGGYQSVR
jgi:cyclopropane-fatty-acyl-phospholipid synthase